MANNGLTKFVTSAKAIIGIAVVLVGLIVWFVTMKEDVEAHDIQLKALTPDIKQNREDIIGIKKDIGHIKGAVDRIEKKL